MPKIIKDKMINNFCYMKRFKYSLKVVAHISLLCFGILFLNKSISQVNLQTGSATFSIPMFNWQDNKSRLNSVVALSYSSGNGLKVNDVASNVGQGWSLVAGGVITRMQVGESDDQMAHGLATESDLSKFPNGYLYATEPPIKGCPEALTKYPLYESKNKLYANHNKVTEDRQLDYFTFQFNGKAGMFILDPFNLENGEDHAISLGDSKIKIKFQKTDLRPQNIRTTITSFTIQDVDGLIYKFSAKGLMKVLKTSYCDASLNYIQTQPKFKNKRTYHETDFEDPTIPYYWKVSSWHLTEIKDPLTNRIVTFGYARTNDGNNMAGRSFALYDNHDSNKPDYVLISHRRSITRTPELSSIVYPDGHAVNFNYGSERFDLKGDYVLSSVDIKYQNRFLSKYKLNTTYFIKTRYGTPTSTYQKRYARLCLKSVQKIGVDLKEDTPPYIFDYNMGSNNPDDFVPPPFHYIKDAWGFYNGSNMVSWDNSYSLPLDGDPTYFTHDELSGICLLNQSTSGTYMSPKSPLAQNGLLRQIIYPTGGTLTYEYKQNWGDPGTTGTYRMVGGVHVDKTISTDGGFSNGCSNAISTSYNYVLENSTTSSLWGLDVPVNKMTMTNSYSPEVKKYHWTWSSAPFGECFYKYMYPGILNRQQATNLGDFQRALQAIAPALGILSIVTTIMDIVTVATGGSPWALIIDVIGGLINITVTCFLDMSRTTQMTIYYDNDLNSSAPLPTQFKRVEVIENPGTIGKTVQEFTSLSDYPLWFQTNEAFTMRQRFASWAYGLPLRTTVLDAGGKKVKEVENTYDFSNAKRNIQYCDGGHGLPCNASGLNTRLVSCNCLVKQSTSQRSDDWSDPTKYSQVYKTNSTSAMDVVYYGHYTGRTELKSTQERIFKANDDTKYVESKTEYIYNLNNYQVSEVVAKQSNGDENKKFIRYADDNSGGIFNVFKQNNIIGIPVQTQSFIRKIVTGDPNEAQLHETRTAFIQTTNGEIKPSEIFEKRFSKPLISWVPGTVMPSEKLVQSITYDNSGNMIGIKDEGNHVVTNLYGYNDKYIIASVINAESLIDKCAYADFEVSSGWYGWALNGTTSYANTAITGSQSFILSSPSAFVANLNTAKPYIVSFWSTTANITVSGGTLVKSAPTLNGFTYFEYEIAQGTSSVSVGGNGTIDELRLYPKTARMRTVSYDPLIGKTSECDANNRITYYEYDNLGRLQFIKDEQKNIVKMYEYNNVSEAKQNGCPGTYSNKLITETFTKACSTGYMGSQVVYTVPANKYTSTKSQEDADKQAENELLSLGQQTANSSGQCLTVYYNAAISRTDTSECGEGFKGGPVTYTVPANRYSSTISQAHVNELALDDLEANAWAWINHPNNKVCLLDTNPYWVWDNDSTKCMLVNGVMHQFRLFTDVNPNSSSYNQKQWKDTGVQTACPQPTCNGCVSPREKCVGGVCEGGIKVYTSCYFDSVNNNYVLVYHYEWSDGSWSGDYLETSPNCNFQED